ncbi:Sensor kinase protein RcsC [Serratia rubidaea]|uniref:Sensor kinase protein RcsC n=1 Tax=Serratia rubidaea TaxID=61652 RepID=A0A4U9HLJ4_SERRU|nr:Sensor kinase protein RcsC [Serratia rubidaea]
MVERFKMLILNAVLLNLLSAIVLFTLAWLFERKMFLPAEENAFRLEEHEQFNRKIGRIGAGGHLYPAHQRRHQYPQ